MSPLVSVTVVSYNQKEFIAECLDSIINQDYPNFEICIADDCSTDGTAEIIEDYVHKYPLLFKFIKGDRNIGPTRNCNLALMAVSGKYCAMTAGDDIMLPGKLSAQVHLMESDPDCRISYHNSSIIHSTSGNILGYSKDVSYAGTGTFETLIEKGCFIGACTAMIRSECMPHFLLDERLILGADWKFHLDILETGGHVRFIDQVLAKHLRHSNNITSSVNPETELKRFQDVVTTCGLILCKHPKLEKLVRDRLSAVLREMRGIDGGKNYKNYLSASMSYKFNYKACLGLLLNTFGIRR